MTWQEVFAETDILRDLITRVGEGGFAAVFREVGVRPHVYYYDKLRTACLEPRQGRCGAPDCPVVDKWLGVPITLH